MDNGQIDWKSVVDEHKDGAKESHVLTVGGLHVNRQRNVLKDVYELYQTNRTEFSKFSGIKYKTLESWETNGCSELGLILLQKFIELKEIENKHQIELEQYKDKAERFDVIYNALMLKNH